MSKDIYIPLKFWYSGTTDVQCTASSFFVNVFPKMMFSKMELVVDNKIVWTKENKINNDFDISNMVDVNIFRE